jgi:hypothetical protein
MTTIMQFIPGKCLDEILSDVQQSPNVRAFSSEQLSDLGSLVVFDMFVNNQDRIPCGIWSNLNEGNAGNCIVTNISENGVLERSVTGIDQNIVTLNPFKNSEKLKSLIEKVWVAAIGSAQGVRW